MHTNMVRGHCRSFPCRILQRSHTARKHTGDRLPREASSLVKVTCWLSGSTETLIRICGCACTPAQQSRRHKPPWLQGARRTGQEPTREAQRSHRQDLAAAGHSDSSAPVVECSGTTTRNAFGSPASLQTVLLCGYASRMHCQRQTHRRSFDRSATFVSTRDRAMNIAPRGGPNSPAELVPLHDCRPRWLLLWPSMSN